MQHRYYWERKTKIENAFVPEDTDELKEEKNCGVQPIDKLMKEMKLKDADLVNASTQQLTFKMVKKACKGRRLTPRVKYKVLNAIQALIPDRQIKLKHLFNYE